MVIVWDEAKRRLNLAKHGLDFATLDLDFFATAVIRPAKKGRFAAFGLLAGRPTAAVFAVLGDEAISVVSMRPASRSERRRYAPQADEGI